MNTKKRDSYRLGSGVYAGRVNPLVSAGLCKLLRHLACWGLLAGSALAPASSLYAQTAGSATSTATLRQLAPEEVPVVGSFFYLSDQISGRRRPPAPGLPEVLRRLNLPTYTSDQTPGRFLVDDTSIDRFAVEQQAQTQSELAPVTAQSGLSAVDGSSAMLGTELLAGPTGDGLGQEPDFVQPPCGTNDIYTVWLTNFLVLPNPATNWTVYVTVAGGTNGAVYDLFRTRVLSPENQVPTPWEWLMSASACDTLVLTNEPGTAFYVLGTPLDSDHDGITDAFASLIPDSFGRDSNGNGVPDWLEIQMGFDPYSPNGLGHSQPGYELFVAQPRSRPQVP